TRGGGAVPSAEQRRAVPEPPPPSLDDAFERAAAVLRDATEVSLACHVNPDPDALGSMLGLSAFRRARGVRTTCSYGNEPFEHPRWVAELPGADALVPPKR